VTTSPVMEWLAQGLSLTLLLDLADAAGPDSTGILAAERPVDDPIWLDAAVPQHQRRGRLRSVG
jgi:hypothetical protein